MSGRGRYNGHTDDVESYRQRSRQNDRRHREHDQDQGNHGWERRSNNDDDGEARMRQKKLALDREQRMARLREEIKREDETLATLDKQQSQDQSGSDEKKQSELEKKPQETIIEVNQEELEGLDEEEKMRRLLGFNGFGSTKGQAVDDNQSTAARGGAAKNKARKYRQYMNRKNGFNRPLEKMK